MELGAVTFGASFFLANDMISRRTSLVPESYRDQNLSYSVSYIVDTKHDSVLTTDVRICTRTLCRLFGQECIALEVNVPLGNQTAILCTVLGGLSYPRH